MNEKIVKPRAVLLTDSLGCPREEVSVDNVWTDLILSEFSDRITFYTLCIYGLSVKDISERYIDYLNPDLIVCQIGIVDACRRALGVKEEKIISKIPLLRNAIHRICSKKHYALTKIRNIHRATPKEFSNRIDSLIKKASRQIVFLEIAPPGNFLINKTYNIKNDIIQYNKILCEKEDMDKIKIIKPYSQSNIKDCNEYILKSDGHHLNNQGHIMVYHEVRDYLNEYLNKYLGGL